MSKVVQNLLPVPGITKVKQRCAEARILLVIPSPDMDSGYRDDLTCDLRIKPANLATGQRQRIARHDAGQENSKFEDALRMSCRLLKEKSCSETCTLRKRHDTIKGTFRRYELLQVPECCLVRRRGLRVEVGAAVLLWSEDCLDCYLST